MPELALTLESTREPALTPESTREWASMPDSTRAPAPTPDSTREPVLTQGSTRESVLTLDSTREPMSTPASMAGVLSMAASSGSRCASAAAVRQTPPRPESGGWWPSGCWRSPGGAGHHERAFEGVSKGTSWSCSSPSCSPTLGLGVDCHGGPATCDAVMEAMTQATRAERVALAVDGGQRTSSWWRRSHTRRRAEEGDTGAHPHHARAQRSTVTEHRARASLRLKLRAA